MAKVNLSNSIPSTKIIATIGPSTWEDDILKRMFDLGVSVARINASFADHDELLRVSNQIRKLSPRVAIMADTQGHKIRINKIAKPFHISQGELLRIGARPGEGDVWVDYPDFAKDIKEGQRVLIDDGKIVLQIQEIKKDAVTCLVKFGGELRPLKTVNLPDTHLSFPPLTLKDEKDVEFAVKHKFDYIAISFIRNVKDVAVIKEYTMGSDTKIIAKIENFEGIENFDSILAEVDGIMVARGDLGVEMPPEDVPILQKEMIFKCRLAGKPVIVATQMLESMRENASPTRAEINDVANAVFDGTDAVMLSAETSTGKYPVEAVSYMARACMAAEKVCDSDILGNVAPVASVETDAISKVVVDLTTDLPIKKIVVGSNSGATVAAIARHRPQVGILAFVPSQILMRQLNVFKGVTAVCVEEKLPGDRDWVVQALAKYGLENNHLKAEDMIIMVTGSGIAGKSRNSIVEVAKVYDVCE